MNIAKPYASISAITKMRWLEALIGLGCGIVAYGQFIYSGDPEVLYRVSGAFAGVGGTLLGFMIAGLSILTAVIDRRAVVNLRKTGHYDVLLHEVYWTSAWYLVTTIISLLSLFLVGEWLVYGVSAATAAMVFATLLFVSAGRKFALVMKVLQ